MSHRHRITCCLVAACWAAAPAAAADLVKDGKPVAVVVIDSPPADPPPKPVKGKKRPAAAAKAPQGDALAAQVLRDWVKKITDAELTVAAEAPAGATAVYVGKAAVRAGLKLDDIASPSREGVRVVVEPGRVLIAGQSEPATLKAVCRFLEDLGCRYFMDGPLGEVYPRSRDLTVAPKTITEKPGLLYRNPKGPSWNAALWKAWNGAGGEPFGHSHSWGGYIPKDLFDTHPEYFAQGADGKRKRGDWLCTSNPGARAFFAERLVERIKAGSKHPSISPPDGRGYCQCEACKAQDDPKSVEPSSGNVSVSTRYADFFDDVARRVAKECPEAVLSFYCYADYTQPPSGGRKLSPNLCAVIAPIRYCRLHALGWADCPSRAQQLDMAGGWAKVASRLGYYNYMYNLADATLPSFKLTPCKTEFPYLADKGLAYMTVEIVSNWYLYGPQMYLSLRMAYDPRLDADAVMEDYWQKFYGPAAGPMKAYWLGLDDAMKAVPCHSGGFYGLDAAFTPEVMRQSETRLHGAAKAAAADPVYAERVAMHAAGFQNAADYKAVCAAMAAGDFARAQKTFDAMTARIDALVARHQANPEYGTAYLRRFLGKTLAGGVAATAAPNKVLAVLPDRWKLAHDDADEGEKRNFHAADHDDRTWRTAATHSATLSRQGLRENTVLWYRTTFTVPEGHGPLALVFPEVDGVASVWVNGNPQELAAVKLPQPTQKKPAKSKPAAAAPAAPAGPVPPGRRLPFEADVTKSVRPGENVVAVRADNRKITELFLGGILRPVLLVEKGAVPAE